LSFMKGNILTLTVCSILWRAWPPIIHTVTNTIIFAVVAPPLIQAVIKLPEMLNSRETTTKRRLLDRVLPRPRY